MANVNSANGYVGLPAQSITTTAATTLIVPATSAGYSQLPSPAFAAGTGLFIDLSRTTQNSSGTATSSGFVNDLVDGKQFRIRVVGVATLGASSTFQVSLFNGSSSTTSSDTLVSISASYTVTTASSVNFVVEDNLIWDSTSQKLNGFFWSDVNNTYTAAAAITAVTNLSVTNLQFIPAFTFGTSNPSNTVTVKEFLVESV